MSPWEEARPGGVGTVPQGLEAWKDKGEVSRLLCTAHTLSGGGSPVLFGRGSLRNALCSPHVTSHNPAHQE